MDVLLEYHAVFRPEDWRQNILLPFQVPKGYDRLVVRLHYSPKEVRDPAIIRPQIEECVRKYWPKGTQLSETDMEEFNCLYNFVTLSLDCGGDYVGCAHRHPPEQTIIVSAQEASPGFAPRAVTAGEWRVVLHVQAVVDGEVDFRAAVFGLEGGEGDDCIPAV